MEDEDRGKWWKSSTIGADSRASSDAGELGKEDMIVYF
jgi:hypothetical protein